MYRPLRQTPRQLFIGFGIAFVLVNLLMVAVSWLFIRGGRGLGNRDPGGVGICDRQLRHGGSGSATQAR